MVFVDSIGSTSEGPAVFKIMKTSKRYFELNHRITGPILVLAEFQPTQNHIKGLVRPFANYGDLRDQ